MKNRVLGISRKPLENNEEPRTTTVLGHSRQLRLNYQRVHLGRSPLFCNVQRRGRQRRAAPTRNGKKAKVERRAGEGREFKCSKNRKFWHWGEGSNGTIAFLFPFVLFFFFFLSTFHFSSPFLLKFFVFCFCFWG